MAECEAFFGSFGSNIGILVHDLMLARRVAEQRPLEVHDMDGRIYCGCGASLCISLEEKLEARPDHSCATHPPAPARAPTRLCLDTRRLTRPRVVCLLQVCRYHQRPQIRGRVDRGH